MEWDLSFEYWNKNFGCLDCKLWPLEVGYLNTFFHNLVKFCIFSMLPLLQVILISWSNLVQMQQWTIFSWIIGHEEHFWPKSQSLTFGIRWNLCRETLISDFCYMHPLRQFWTYEWTLGILLSILNHILRSWLILRWKFPSGGLSRPKP